MSITRPTSSIQWEQKPKGGGEGSLLATGVGVHIPEREWAQVTHGGLHPLPRPAREEGCSETPATHNGLNHPLDTMSGTRWEPTDVQGETTVGVWLMCVSIIPLLCFMFNIGFIHERGKDIPYRTIYSI